MELIPEAEKAAARLLQERIGDARSYVETFHAALDLFDASNKWLHEARDAHADFRGFSQWQFIAARDGALSIYHFGRLIKDGKLLRDCPSVRDRIDTDAISVARKAFDSQFPGFIDIRNVVGHEAEMRETPQQIAKHSYSGGVQEPIIGGDDPLATIGGLMIRGMLHNRRFIVTWERKLLSYEISQETLERLARIATAFADAFKNAEVTWPPRH